MNKFLFLSILGIPTLVYSQEVDYLNTDRPDQSEGVFVLPKKQFQIEKGIIFSKNQVADAIMLRYGILNTTEIRWESNFSILGERGFRQWDGIFSFKQKLWDGKNFIPSVTFIGYLGYHSNEKWATDMALAFQNTLNERLTLDYNIATSNFFTDINLTSMFNYTLQDNIGLFVEYFATFGKQKPMHNIDIGVLYALSPNLQIDMALGGNLFNKNYYFGNVGVAYRIKSK